MAWHEYPGDDLKADDRKYFRWLREKFSRERVEHLVEMSEAGKQRRWFTAQAIKWLGMAGGAIIFVTSLKQPALDFISWIVGRK